jgi:hypothetical protein
MGMAEVSVTAPRPFGGTMRRDLWWVQPLATFLGLGAFVVYTTWAALQGRNYHFGPYLSPLYSPELFGESPHALFGPMPSWWPAFLPFSPALFILWAPGGFRLTCYYYRGAYYKAFWADPPSCAVGEPRSSYWGERSFPLILQNIHRYFMYLAIGFIFVLAYDVYKALWFTDAATGAVHFGVGVGTLVMLVNVWLLGGYTFSCHSLRHLVGGCMDCPSKSPARLAAWKCTSTLNAKHMLFAWLSLFWVGFTDVYIRLCASGVWSDFRIL